MREKDIKVTSKVGPLLDENNQLTRDSKEMAELLSKQYSSVFRPAKQDVNQKTPSKTTTKLSDITFSMTDMEEAGDDGFPAILLKSCKSSLSFPLTVFWRKCLDDGYIPSTLKQSVITPIHKGESCAIPANYQLAVLTSHLSKILRRY